MRPTSNRILIHIFLQSGGMYQKNRLQHKAASYYYYFWLTCCSNCSWSLS